MRKILFGTAALAFSGALLVATAGTGTALPCSGDDVYTGNVAHGGGTGCQNGADDGDGDGLANGYENRNGLDRDNPDSDADGCIDGAEVFYGSDPLSSASNNCPP